MKLISFLFSHDDIFAGVKQESSLLSERRFDAQGNTLFDELVFDEEYLILFRRLFFEAQANLIPAVSAYLKYNSFDDGFFETRDFTEDRDLSLHLLMPADYFDAYTTAVDIKIKEYLIAYIMYRWLETKMPQEAATFFQRSAACLNDVKNNLEKRLNPVRRRIRWF